MILLEYVFMLKSFTPPLSLSQGVQSSNSLLQKCSLTTMKHVVKSLATRRLSPQRKAFFEITLSLFVYLAKLWTSYLQESLARLTGGERFEPALAPLEMSRICLKSRFSLSSV